MDVPIGNPAHSNAFLVVNNLLVEKKGDWRLSLEETRAIVEKAERELGCFRYDRNAPVYVEEDAVFFVVTFPEPPHEGPGELVCSADFAAKVRFDKDTREIVEIEFGG